MDLPLTRFNQGDRYRARQAEALRRFEGRRFQGLELAPVLYDDVSSRVGEDVAGPGRGLGFALRFLRGMATYVFRGILVADLTRMPALTLSQHGCDSPRGQVWVLMDHSRKSVETQLTNIIGGSPYVALEYDLRGKPTGVGFFRRLLRYGGLFPRCFVPFASDPFGSVHKLAVQALAAGEIAAEARMLMAEGRPGALFLYRDFPAISNTLTQVAREAGVPAYSTQHAVNAQLSGDYRRAGNVVFENSHADVHIAWGEFTKRQMADCDERHHRDRRLLLDARPTAPEERQLDMNKASTERIEVTEIVVSLMGLRHEAENAALLKHVAQFAGDRGHLIKVRPHPSLDFRKYEAFLNDLGRDHGVVAELTDSRASAQSRYTPHSLGVTGLTSTYYENLLFGIPVLMFDYGYTLVEPLPRVLPGFSTAEDLASQVETVEAMTWAEWYAKADPVCVEVYNRPCLDFEPRGSTIDLVRRDAGLLPEEPPQGRAAAVATGER